MKTVIYTTVRAELEHDEPFTSEAQALEYAQELLEYTNVLGGCTLYGDVRVVSVQVQEDLVGEYNKETEDAEA